VGASCLAARDQCKTLGARWPVRRQLGYIAPMRASIFWAAFALGLWLGAEGLLGLLILTIIVGFVPLRRLQCDH
jgi:hypothetical protein